MKLVFTHGKCTQFFLPTNESQIKQWTKKFHAIGQNINQRNFIDKISEITTVESRTMVLFLILAIFFELPITRTVFDFP